ncbi:MAG: asparagine synthase (glutamine-hydrolyzing) [Anaerolineaceae bacterium]|nr:asparagine synthase (glutamine-hydrolyzing) [Anaerolineaceae bacterium]
MCGITGFLDIRRQATTFELESTVRRMADSILHRGPDDYGSWVDAETGLAFGFRRLAILDLSPAGHQPMCSADGRFVIVYNGEIYNFAALRSELEQLGCAFRGHSDTEIMLAAISEWGLKAAVQRFNGMFAFALWDRRERQLSLVRDRLGIKPLYYGWAGKVLLFGSELKTFLAHPDFQGTIDRDALALYLRFNCIHAPYSIYKGVCKLLPGTILQISNDDRPSESEFTTFWSAKEVAEQGQANLFPGTDQEAVQELDGLLRESVKLRMIADVPLGAFLSGGVDSSAVVALMQAQSDRPVKTFTIGFKEADFNEAVYAKRIAQHLGTDHTELYVTAEEAQAVIPKLPGLYDEPYADSSQIPTFLVSELARKHVTVSLSGDGGDELFGGYNRYYAGQQIWNRFGWIPLSLRRAGSNMIDSTPPKLLEGLFKNIDLAGKQDLSEKVRKISRVLSAESYPDVYYRLVSCWDKPSSIVKNSQEAVTIFTEPARWAKLDDFTKTMMYLDLVTYLPEDILVKLDRASMGVSLEARLPLLDDHRLVEFAWRLPHEMKIRGGVQKWILRQVLYQYVPREMIERPKMGFAVPVGEWLRGPLRDWGEALLDEKRLEQEGFFDPAPIRRRWVDHISGKRNWHYHLWEVLMFQAWLSENKTKIVA